ncbi:MAG: hypothetical protein M3396_02195 [Actinomycetota bacterium]|nr:hypothetical protein [Actinomycetota bacterium]
MATKAGVVVLALVLLALAGSPCGGRTPQEQAAVRAQDACIAALEPVAEDQRPSDDALAAASRDAEAAANVDERWGPLRARVREFADGIGSPAGPASLDALVQECERVNRIVKEKRSSPDSLG